MANITIAQAETEAREFAAQFPTANVRRAVEMAEAGRVSWFQIHGLFTKSLADAMA